MIDRLRTDISNLNTQLEQATQQDATAPPTSTGIAQTSDAIEPAPAPTVFQGSIDAAAQPEEGLGKTL